MTCDASQKTENCLHHQENKKLLYCLLTFGTYLPMYCSMSSTSKKEMLYKIVLSLEGLKHSDNVTHTA